jgi:hypothetical protein
MHHESIIDHKVKITSNCKVLQAKTKLALRKSRIRRNAEGRPPTTTLSFQAASSHPLGPETPELQTELSSDLNGPGQDDSQEGVQSDMLWGAGRVSNPSDNQAPPRRQAQQEIDSSSLPEFDADSALAMARKV